jgi:ribosomal protein S10
MKYTIQKELNNLRKINKTYKLIINIYGSDSKRIDEYLKVLHNKKDIIITNTVDLPCKLSKFINIKSPHVHSKSREKYIFKRYNRLVNLSITNRKDIKKLYSAVMSGLEIKIKDYSYI